MGYDQQREDRESFEEQLLEAQTMLAFALLQNGPVEITREAAEKGLPVDAEIAIEPDMAREVIVVRLKYGQ